VAAGHGNRRSEAARNGIFGGRAHAERRPQESRKSARFVSGQGRI